VQDDFANVGIQLKTLYVNSISPTEETAKAIDERASMGAIGDMQAYLQFQTARGIRDAAQAGGEGGVAGAGVGLGAGLGMGTAMAQMISQSGTGQPQEAAPSAASTIPDIMTLSEAAAYMRVGEQDVLDAINSGELKARKIGSSYRISKKAVDEFLGG
jgi:excisionase family DNA binding protein